MIRLTGTIVGEQQLHRSFSRLVALTYDFSEVFEKIGEDVRDILKEQFDLAPWEPLSPAYGAWKALHYPDKTILRRTDRLWRSLTNKTGEDNVSLVLPLHAAFGARPPSGRYGRFHQLGTANMPQRKIFDFTETDKRMFTTTAHRYMLRLGSEAGFFII